MSKQSAEDKLLRLIKDSSRKGEKAAARPEPEPLRPAKVQRPGQPGIDLGVLKPFIKVKRFKFSSLNSLLRLIVISVFLFFIFDLVHSFKEAQELLREDASSPAKEDLNSLPDSLAGNFNDWAASLPKRDIFVRGQGKNFGSAVALGSLTSANYISNLKLLGIISGQTLQAVIEDASEEKSYTVNIGDYFKEFLVEDIGAGRVRLDFKGEKFDLFL